MKTEKKELDGRLRNNNSSEQIIHGRNAVYEVMQSGRRKIKKIILSDSAKGDVLEKIRKIGSYKKIPFEIVSNQILDKMTKGEIHQGVIAYVSEISIFSVDEVLNSIKEKGIKPFFLILNNIQDPHNIGALLRSADGCGVTGVIISSHHSPSINATIIKTSAGASEYVPIIKEANLAQTIDKLKKEGLWIFGAEMDGETNYYDADFNLPLAIVLGNEGEGLQRLVKEKCDFLLKIPMNGKINSLNVSVAGALLMFEVKKKRT